MSVKKQIICLAVSWKKGDFCVAGREIVGQEIGPWIRPIGSGKEGAAKLREIQISPGVRPNILDVVEIGLSKACPERHQRENWEIDPSSPWRRTAVFSKKELRSLQESPETLWVNGIRSSNDRMPETLAHAQANSLFLIRPARVKFILTTSLSGTEQIRGNFNHNDVDYDLVLTDPMASAALKERGLTKKEPEMSLEHPHLCISLGLRAFNGDCYKLIAGFIFP